MNGRGGAGASVHLDDVEGGALVVGDDGEAPRLDVHGAGLALTARVVQTAFASNARSSLGLALRLLPLWGELLVRALVMTAALIVVGVSLQLVLYAEPLGHWFTSGWFTSTLPRIVAIGFAISLVFGALTVRATADFHLHQSQVDAHLDLLEPVVARDHADLHSIGIEVPAGQDGPEILAHGGLQSDDQP